MKLRIALCLMAALSLFACDQSDHKPSDEQGDGNSTVDDPSKFVTRAEEQLEDQSYEDVRGTDDCTDDCSGHNAGWEWAKQNDIAEANGCSGDSDSFVEGCTAYTEEVERLALE